MTSALDYGPALAELLDRIDAAEEELRETTKEKRGEIAKMKKRAKELRDLVSGRRGVQMEMGAAVAVLDEARRVRDRKDD